jgi:hypothetical protein
MIGDVDCDIDCFSFFCQTVHSFEERLRRDGLHKMYLCGCVAVCHGGLGSWKAPPQLTVMASSTSSLKPWASDVGRLKKVSFPLATTVISPLSIVSLFSVLLDVKAAVWPVICRGHKKLACPNALARAKRKLLATRLTIFS